MAYFCADVPLYSLSLSLSLSLYAPAHTLQGHKKLINSIGFLSRVSTAMMDSPNAQAAFAIASGSS